VKDRRTLVMLAAIAILAVLAGFYLFGAGEDGETHGWAYPAGAILLLLLLVGMSAGASRNRRVVRDEEERKDG
jgi:drug/metabolite transporter (DMT)-like permease